MCDYRNLPIRSRNVYTSRAKPPLIEVNTTLVAHGQCRARASLDATIADARRLEGQLPVSAIYAALHVTGISRVDLTKPADGVVCDKRHYPRAAS